MSLSSQLNAQCVATYLQQYPDFFNDHQELLEILAIPHPTSGNVVSLIARQMEVFKHKQHKLEDQLKYLLEIARDNDVCASRMHKLTLALLNSATLEAAITNLKRVLTECFLTDFVALKMISENDNATLNDFFIAPNHKNLAFVSVELIHKKPRCGRLNAAQNQFFFTDFASEVKSCAIIPLLTPDLTGLLVIGSRDENRFQHTMGDLFLTQLSEIVGLRLATLLKQ